MLCLSRLDVEARGLREGVEPGEDLLELFGVQQIAELSATGGDEEENTPQRNLEALHQGDQVLDLSDVPAAERGIDLDRESDFVGPANGVERSSKRARHAPACVMRLGARAIHAHRKTCETSLFQAYDHLPGQQWSSARGEGYTNAHRAGMTDQFKEIGPLQRIASSEHKDRNLQVGNLVNQMLPFCSGEFHRMAIRLRVSAAMNTSQIAGLRDLPDRNEWAFVEIDRIDERIHDAMKPDSAVPRSDKSYCGRNWQGLVWVVEA